MGGDPSKRNQSLYCHYHQEKGNTTKDCRNLHDHLGQVVKAGKLRQFLHQPASQFEQPETGYQRDGAPRPALGTITVIFAKPKGDAGTCSRVMSVVSGPDGRQESGFQKGQNGGYAHFRFSKEEKEGTF